MTIGIGCFVSLQLEIIFLVLGEEKERRSSFSSFSTQISLDIAESIYIYILCIGQVVEKPHNTCTTSGRTRKNLYIFGQSYSEKVITL